MTFDLIIVGVGRVARRFVSLLEEQQVVSARVVETVTRRPDSVAHVRRLVKQYAAAARAGRLVVVESTTLDVKTGEPAIGHIRAALKGGAHAITVNKGPVAFAYADLAREAATAGRQFLFEGAVMDGVPVFNFARHVLPGITINGFRGVVNSTTNYIITAVEQGDSFGSSLAAMQRAGIAEADASLDIDGWDAAAKTAALANVLLDARITPHDVQRESLTEASTVAIRGARSAGRRMKVVAWARGRGSGVHARVGLMELPEGDLLAGLDGPQNALVLDTDLLGEVAIVELGSGLTQTAYGLLTDLVTISRARPARRGRTPSPRGRRER
ncbi:MAG TPA: hypothetical protein VFA59_23830 [Vicinamibacterales bacterium]|nr:hypothetical protein [Vicinamibacterales bacterium]